METLVTNCRKSLSEQSHDLLSDNSLSSYVLEANMALAELRLTTNC